MPRSFLWGARECFQRAGCLKALRSLERSGQLMRPAPRTPPARLVERRLGEPVAAPLGVEGEVTDLVYLALVRGGVDDTAHRVIWNELMAREQRLLLQTLCHTERRLS
ncbi:hypothetical protein [Ectothiorhodospira variabilis]|uniref:hypothetical protein n=1 Tax=Ectothiorhodospira variabilis TaxID=505694 RepID=UPI001EFBFE11|nr:hypothetical protein [Ectothiorhodospira variabilis]MCG5493249.1 hypothetical protein [Ectothiorhodospira variabilis]MCG5502578.1 hypothetical protein [Ectothiorhodospira variabilis]MCG5505656.1 hypothetical protein [Ectothiorhodospira variabilis]